MTKLNCKLFEKQNITLKQTFPKNKVQKKPRGANNVWQYHFKIEEQQIV